jgi:NCS2 family nucleobase:cation symporter-2
MIVLGAGTILQSRRMGPIGSGYMCPATFTATYFGPSLLAAQAGGLPLVFGMTVFAGLLEVGLAPLLNRLRAVMPPEISGLVIFVIGLSGGLAGLRTMVGERAAPVSEAEWWVAGITLVAMIVFNVWARGIARMLCALIGLVIGYGAAAYAGLLSADDLHTIAAGDWIGWPSFGHLAWSFDGSLAAPFVIACLAATMKAVGTIAVCQRVNDDDWVRPEMRSITRGVIADGATTAIAGLAGTFGTNASTPSVGLSAATGVASRKVAYAIAIVFVIVGLLPKVTVLLAVMPRPVIVAALLFSVTFIMINGLQVMMSRMLDARRTLVIGLALVAGMMVEAFPAVVASAPDWARSLVGSSLVFATLVALVLNLVFRLGITQVAHLSVAPGPLDSEALMHFMERAGGAWGAQRDVIERAKFNLTQSLEVILESVALTGNVEVSATYDEFNLDVRVAYDGSPLELPEQRPTDEEIMESDDGHLRLAGYMLRQFADRVNAQHRDGRSTIHFHFDH